MVFAREISISDMERLGPVIEQLLDSGKLTEDERWAVDLAARAAADLALTRHSETAVKFYDRSEMQKRLADSVSTWLAANANAEPGTVTTIAGRIHVASIDRNGRLQLLPLREL